MIIFFFLIFRLCNVYNIYLGLIVDYNTRFYDYHDLSFTVASFHFFFFYYYSLNIIEYSMATTNGNL